MDWLAGWLAGCDAIGMFTNTAGLPAIPMSAAIDASTVAAYAAPLREYLVTDGFTPDVVESVLTEPYQWPSTLARFREVWNAHVETRDAAPVEAVETGASYADRESVAAAMATLRRREADALADRDRYRTLLASAPTTLDELKRSPLWQDLAREAAEAAVEEGFCGEYDRMARAIGLPDRDDVLGSRQYSRSYLVTIRVNESTEMEWGDGAPSSYVELDLDSVDWELEDTPRYVEWDED